MKESELIPLLDSLGRHPARLESLVADLVRRGIAALSEVEVQPVSTFARNYSPDVDTASIVEYPDGKVLRLRTHREGLYDQLPAGLFHRPEPYYPGQKLSARLEESRAAREREAAARKFFSPIEQEFFTTSIKAELTEDRLTDAFNSPLRRQLLLAIWPHCSRVPARSLTLLSYVLPLAHRIAGYPDLMAACYRAALQAPVEMRFAEGQTDAVHAGEVVSAGDRLGVDLNLGGVPPADLPELLLTVGPIPRDRCEEFLPGGSAAELLTLLNDCLVPYEVDIKTRIKFARGEAELLRLNDDRDRGSRLGFTSRLALTA